MIYFGSIMAFVFLPCLQQTSQFSHVRRLIVSGKNSL